jgi:hypothetical protein
MFLMLYLHLQGIQSVKNSIFRYVLEHLGFLKYRGSLKLMLFLSLIENLLDDDTIYVIELRGCLKNQCSEFL